MAMPTHKIKKRKTFRKIAASLGILQSLTWLVLAIICIVVYYRKPKNDFSEPLTFRELISRNIYTMFLDKNVKHLTNPEPLLKPTNFHIVVWIYAFLSVFWLALSLHEYFALSRKITKLRDTYLTITLGICTVTISVLDLVIFGILLHQFMSHDIVKNSTENDLLETLEMRQANGIVMTLVARGFVLWVFNCITGVSIIQISVKILRAPPLMNYENNSIPRLKFQPATPSLKIHEFPHEPVFFEDFDTFKRSSPQHFNGRTAPRIFHQNNRNSFF